MGKVMLPSFLNFNRSISPSEGLMFGISSDSDVSTPVEVVSRGIRGTISNYANIYKKDKAESAANIDKQLKDPKNANLQEVQVAFLPLEATRLALRFSLVVQANSLAPSGCNAADFYDEFTKAAARYAELGGYEYLAERYVWNVINGRVLWRNRFSQNKIAKISIGTNEEFVFNTDNMRLDRYERDAMPENFDKLVAEVGGALSGKRGPLFVTVEVSGEMPAGAEVYPSQEFLPEAKQAKDSGKVLSAIEIEHNGRRLRQGTMHSQKIGNAIRCIDEWHGQTDEFGATAIEVYGYIQSRTDALRVPTRPDGTKGAPDLFVMLKDLEAVNAKLEAAKSASEIDGNIHYMMAVIIRGGVFSGEKKGS